MLYGQYGHLKRINQNWQRLHFRVCIYEDEEFFAMNIFIGGYIGTFVTMLFGGVIAADWSWEWVFHLSGKFILIL